MFFDWTYIVYVMPAVLFAMWASHLVNSTYAKYSQQFNSRGLTAERAARFVLDRNGLQNVRIERISGNLTDHYDPQTNIVRLSDSVYGSTSSAAIGVACHEVGHAIQHAVNYAPIRIRTAIVPITNLGAELSMPLIIGGLLLSSFSSKLIILAYLGIACFGLSTIFQLVTLPTEFDASRRALKSIEEGNLLMDDELKGAKKVLTAAALTYVAALAVSAMQLLRFLVIVGGRRRDD